MTKSEMESRIHHIDYCLNTIFFKDMIKNLKKERAKLVKRLEKKDYE